MPFRLREPALSARYSIAFKWACMIRRAVSAA